MNRLNMQKLEQLHKKQLQLLAQLPLMVGKRKKQNGEYNYIYFKWTYMYAN